MEHYTLEQWQQIVDWTVDAAWPRLLNFECRTKYTNRKRPIVKVMDSAKKYRTSSLASTQMVMANSDKTPLIYIWLPNNLKQDKGIVLTTIIHELLHARGWLHGFVRGFRFGSHTHNDKVSEVFINSLFPIMTHNVRMERSPKPEQSSIPNDYTGMPKMWAESPQTA